MVLAYHELTRELPALREEIDTLTQAKKLPYGVYTEQEKSTLKSLRRKKMLCSAKGLRDECSNVLGLLDINKVVSYVNKRVNGMIKLLEKSDTHEMNIKKKDSIIDAQSKKIIALQKSLNEYEYDLQENEKQHMKNYARKMRSEKEYLRAKKQADEARLARDPITAPTIVPPQPELRIHRQQRITITM